jgi:TrmH family RNA methyltransferase
LHVNSISSPSNALLKRIRGLHERKNREKSNAFLIEGAKGIAEAIAKNVRIRDLVVSESFWKQQGQAVVGHEIDVVTVVDDKLMRDISTQTTPAGILATAEMPRFAWDEVFEAKDGQAPLVVIAHSIQDPGNLGTIFRTALAASATGVVCTRGTVDCFNPKVVRAASGALFAMPCVWDVSFEDAIAHMRERGVRVVAAEPTASETLFDCDLRGPVAIVLGNEGQGFTAADLELVDQQVSIPMNPASESLNVAICGAIVLFNVVQQRRKTN